MAGLYNTRPKAGVPWTLRRYRTVSRGKSAPQPQAGAASKTVIHGNQEWNIDTACNRYQHGTENRTGPEARLPRGGGW